jgi:hypothetical protein
MMELIAWGVLALVHLMPAAALVRPSLITSLYGIAPDNTAFPLMQHRAALFAVVLVICIGAMIDPATRRLASVAVALSMISFLALYLTNGAPSALRPIAIADMIGLPALAYVAWRAFSA